MENTKLRKMILNCLAAAAFLYSAEGIIVPAIHRGIINTRNKINTSAIPKNTTPVRDTISLKSE